MEISQSIQSKINQIANELQAANGGKRPTVAEVRAIAQMDMNTTSIAMKAWRQNKTVIQEIAEDDAPDCILNEINKIAKKIWSIAKAEAEQNLRDAETRYSKEREEAEELRAELSEAYDNMQKKAEMSEAQAQAEIEKLSKANAEIEQLKAELIEAKRVREMTQARLFEQTEHINSLKAELIEAKTSFKKEREQHVTTKTQALENEEKAKLERAKAQTEINKAQEELERVKTQALENEEKAKLERAKAQTEINKAQEELERVKTQAQEQVIELAKAKTKDEIQTQHVENLKELLNKLAEKPKAVPKTSVKKETEEKA